MAETAVRGCHCLGVIAVRMRSILAKTWVGVRVCHLLLLFVLNGGKCSEYINVICI